MKTLTQKQTYPIAPGILLVLLVLACLRVMPLLAQESSLLLPPRQPSELLLPALESALSQPTKGSSSFLKSQSFEVREAAKQHKAGHDNAPRRLKSAASTVSQTQNSSGKTQTPFPTVGALPLAAQKPVVPATALNAAGQNASAFKEVLQYDSTGLFALKLVRVPVLDNVPNTDSATNALPPVNLPPFPVSADKTAAPDSRTTLPLSQASQPLPNTTNASNADNVKHNPGEGAALAAIGATPKLGSPVAEKHESQQAVVQQKASSPATNPLLVLPSSHPSAVGAKAPIAPVEQSQAKKTQPQLATASKAPAPAMKNNSFDLSSAAMEYVAGGSIPEGKNVPASDKPVPSLKSDNKSPWFARLPQDDFLIGFDNEEEIGRAQSSIFLGPNGEVR
ncbi:MAG: hypothetical protein PHQ75_01680, partial [Thermoguttaceae bacterium]|nr:hypothetical protein [Thermoguttaceae bacterium]